MLDVAAAVGQQAQYGGLDAPHGDEAARFDGEQAREVHAHKPVGFGAGEGGKAEVTLLLVGQ